MSRPARLRYCLTVVSLNLNLTNSSVANAAIAALTEEADAVPRRNVARCSEGEQPRRRLFLRLEAACVRRAVARGLSG